MLKIWFKQQLTELSAWAGFLLMISHYLPNIFVVSFGVLLISIDDDKAKAWCLKVAPWLENKVNQTTQK